MAKRLLQGLAITFGGGLALGAGFKLGQATTRPKEAGGAGLTTLNRRLEAFEQRIEQVESRPPSGGPGPLRSDDFESQLLNQSLNALESRLADRIEMMGDHLRKVETRFGSEMEAGAKRQSAQITALGRRLEEIQTKLRSEIEIGDRRSQEQTAGIAQELRTMESRLPAQVDAAVASRMEALNRKLESDLQKAQDRTLEALVDTLDTKVVQRMSDLESSLLGQSEAIGGLREKSLRTDQNMQKLLVAVERLCEQTERQMARRSCEPEEEPEQAPTPVDTQPPPEPLHDQQAWVPPPDRAEPAYFPEPTPEPEPAHVEAAVSANGNGSAPDPESGTAPGDELDRTALELLGPDPKPKKRWRIPLAFSLFTISGTLTSLH
jgi:cell division septation protein DedD